MTRSLSNELVPVREEGLAPFDPAIVVEAPDIHEFDFSVIACGTEPSKQPFRYHNVVDSPCPMDGMSPPNFPFIGEKRS